MKKFMTVAAAMLLSASMMACGSSGSSSSSSTLTDGTYTGTAKGFGDDGNADVSVELTVSGGAITDVQITGDGETPEVGQAAFEELANQIKDANGADIDGVAGATVTSTGVKAAVEDALN